MGLIRYGDPDGFPDIDTMEKRGIKYNLDTVWRGDWEAANREKQLTQDGKTVYILSRYAPPEEVKNHLPFRGIEGIDKEKVRLDGRYTLVYDVWVAVGRTYRKKQSTTPKLKMISINNKQYDKNWEKWVGDDYATSRRKIYQKPKTKRSMPAKHKDHDITDDILQVTKASVVGVVGMGVAGMLGGMLRKHKKLKPKVKKCGCK